MEKSVCVILHWNTDYAEIPRKDLPEVVENSYKVMLSSLEGFEGKICCNITGHTLEYLQKHNPEIIDQLRSLVSSGIIELLGTGYSHPIFPLIHPKRVESQILSHKTLNEDLFNIKLKGFWPPELGVSPTVLSIIKKSGFEWVTVDHEHLLISQSYSNNENPFEKRKKTVTEILSSAYWSGNFVSQAISYIKALRNLTKMNKNLKKSYYLLQINNEEAIKCFLSSQSWWNSTRFALSKTTFLYSESKHIKLIKQSKCNLLPIYTSDIEFFGFREFGGKIPQPVSLVNFLNRLQLMDIPTVSPTDLLPKKLDEEAKFISTGSWSGNKSLDIWSMSEDNKEFSRQLDEIYSYLRSHNWNQELIKKIDPYLRIAENSDARGWSPLPERKLEAYSAIQKIQQILES